MKRGFVFMLLSVLFVVLCVTGCSSKEKEATLTAESATPEQQASEQQDDIVIETIYGSLRFPGRWMDRLQVDQAEYDDLVEVAFSAGFNGNVIPLFSIVIGGGSDDAAGVLTADDGTQRNVYVIVEEIVEDDYLSHDELEQLYGMQEDLNYLIDNLK